jgi:hypothetical protein
LRINLSIDYNITIRRDSGLLEQTVAPKPRAARFMKSMSFAAAR